MLGCIHALLLAGATTQLIDVHGGTAPQWAEVQGQPTTAELTRQHEAPPQLAAASPAAPPDAVEPAVSALASLPFEIFQSAGRGELRKVASWLRKGGPIDALCPGIPTDGGQYNTYGLLHAATSNGQLEMVWELLKRGASADRQTGTGYTVLMSAAFGGHLSILLLLLQLSADPDLQSSNGVTALMTAAGQGREACVQTLLQAKANTELLDNDGHTALQWAEHEGHLAIAALIRQHAAPPHPAAVSPAAPPDAGEPVASPPPTSLPLEVFKSAQRGELQKVVRWLRKGGLVDALCPVPTVEGGQTAAFGLLHAAATNGQLEMARELLKRGASVDLRGSLGTTALMNAAYRGHLSILLFLLHHSANPDLQATNSGTALINAASKGQEACVQALLRAGANIQLLDKDGHTGLWWAEEKGHTATAKLIRQHASCLSLGLGVALCARVPLAWPWVVLSVVLGALATVAFSRMQFHEGRAERTKGQARSKKSKKKKKAGRATAAGDEPSEAPPAAALAPPPTATPKPAASAAERAEAALRAVIAGGGLSELEAALAAAPREVREGSVGAEARARFDRLLEAQQEAERKAKKQEAATEAARLAVAERAREVAAQEAGRVAAASKAREAAKEAATTAAAAAKATATAEAEANALERATADGNQGGGSGAAGPSEASEVAVPDQYMCSITAEIMIDPVCTVRAFCCPRGLSYICHTLLSRPRHSTFYGLPSLS